MRRNEDEAFALRALFKFEYALHCFAIVRIATQAVAGLGGIGDETAAFEMSRETSERYGELAQLAPPPWPSPGGRGNMDYFRPMAR